MESLFICVLNMSLTASYVIIAIIPVRLFLKKSFKTISYVLWTAVGLRLAIPFTVESIFSLIPFSSQPISQIAAPGENGLFGSSAGAAHEVIGDAVNAGLETITVNLGNTAAGYPITTEAYRPEVWLMLGSYLWILGISALLIYSLVSIILLKFRLHVATQIKDNIYEAENLKTPFVLGFFHPKIYIPSGLSEEERGYIILHEQTHIRRFDHLVKMVAFFIVCVHWFNPLAWVAFQLMNSDMEMSCDECVLKKMGGKIKQAYSSSLISLATGRHMINGSPLAFGEGNINRRIKNILKFKKPATWVVVVSITLVAALIIGFISNRPATVGSFEWEEYKFPSYLYDRVTFNTQAEIYPLLFDAINAILTNKEMETGLTCGKAFTLVKQVGDDWRVVPFVESVSFDDVAINLSVGVSETYSLTPDMLPVKLDVGNYRIITEVWYFNEQSSQTVRTVWTDFIISETKWSLTVDDVRELAKMGDALRFEDFDDLKSLDASSNTNYHIMVYYVNGGYRLIVRTDGNKIDNANLERVWDSGGSGIDIRYNDVDEFIKSHPSTDAINLKGIKIGTSRDEVHKIMGEPVGMLSGLFGDIFKLDDDLNIIIYYDAKSKVYHINVTEKSVDTSSPASAKPPSEDMEIQAD